MTEQQLLGASLYSPLASAVLKDEPSDFQVYEVLDIPFTGQGEHVWLLIEKQQLNTEQVAKQLAMFAKVSIRQVSYAGLKDKQAITRQWFSVQMPGKAVPDFSALNNPQLQVIEQVLHQRKLQRGSHKANQFVLTLKQIEALDQAQLTERLALISQQGVPNYFGLQRFGHDGFNVNFARQFAEQKTYPDKRPVRSRCLSAARSYLFNQVLAARVKDQNWNQLLAGDLLSFTDSASYFPLSEMQADDSRFAELDTHPTGALWGAGALPSSEQAASYEQAVIDQESELAHWLAEAGLKQERRILRLPVSGLTCTPLIDGQVTLSFSLPVGCYATVVLREIFTLVSHAVQPS